VSLPGGANSAQLADDGGFVVTNNGGIDFTVFADALRLEAGKIPYRPGPPGLQRVAPDGGVSVLAHEGLQAPNDLIVAPTGRSTSPIPRHTAACGAGQALKDGSGAMRTASSACSRAASSTTTASRYRPKAVS
jgi:hypothetical protein